MAKTFLILGSLNGFLAVSLGAFAAHGLKNVLSADLLTVFQTGVQYHFYHALGLLAVGLILQQMPEAFYVKLAGWLLLAGIILFSGSLYALTLSGVRSLGMITPFGGLSFLAGWLLLAIALWLQ